MTSSGSARSAKAVKPRRSQNTTTISRRWLSRIFSSPCDTINSASCGARNRFNRPTRPNSSTCAATLGREILQQADLLVGERPYLLAEDVDDAEQSAVL